MQHERHDRHGNDLAEIWRRAQHRRSEDLYVWFTNIFKKRWQFKSRYRHVGALLRSFAHNGETFVLPEIEQPPLKGARAEGGRSGQ